jgi:hypothetical protein
MSVIPFFVLLRLFKVTDRAVTGFSRESCVVVLG